MHSPAQGRLRVIRIAAFTSSVMALSLGAHLAGGGVRPSVVVVAMLTLTAALAVSALASKRCAPLTIASVLAVSQLVLHYAYAFFAPVGGCGGVLTVDAHLHHAGSMASCVGGAADGVGTGTMPAPSLWMFACHVLATVMTAAVLSRGEQFLWRVADRLLPRWLTPLAPSLWRAAQIRSAAPEGHIVRPRPIGGVGRRGPPAALAAATV